MHSHKRAVIDIGSNSVRMVIYAITCTGPRAWLNEKSVAGLGRDMARTGALHPEGRLLAQKAVRRFADLLRAHGVTSPLVFATAAVRESTDGADFARLIESDIGAPVRILSGRDEARMAALAILSALKKPRGLVCDLGGRSLEVASVADGSCHGGESRPIGPLALESLGDAGSAPVKSAVREAVEHLVTPAPCIYAIGGSWRAIGRLHQHLRRYPLPVIHNYTVRAKALRATLQALLTRDKKAMEAAGRVAARRLRHMPHTALVLDRLIAAGNSKQIVFSGVGVREGMLTAHPAPHTPGADDDEFGLKLARWLADLSPWCGEEYLVARACDIVGMAHGIASCRAETAFALAVHTPWTSFTHSERAFIALSVACRYRRGFAHPVCDRLLNAEQCATARALGAAMRLGTDLSSGSAQLLMGTQLACSDQTLELRIDRTRRSLASDMVSKRLSQAAEALRRQPELHVSGAH